MIFFKEEKIGQRILPVNWNKSTAKIFGEIFLLNWNGNTARNFLSSNFSEWEHLLGIFSARILDGENSIHSSNYSQTEENLGKFFKRKKLGMGRMELKKNQAATETPGARFLCKNDCENHGKNKMLCTKIKSKKSTNQDHTPHDHLAKYFQESRRVGKVGAIEVGKGAIEVERTLSKFRRLRSMGNLGKKISGSRSSGL